MDQTGRRLPLDQCHPQCTYGEAGFQTASQSPADHTPGEGIQHHGQVHELRTQPNAGDVGNPELIDSAGAMSRARFG